MDGINFNLHTNDLSRIFVKLKHIHDEYIPHFHSKMRHVATQAIRYLQGKFLEKGRGNMTRCARNVPDSNNQSMQNCISDSPWDVRPVIAPIQKDVTELIGDGLNGYVHIDESGFPKQGTESVGVKRQ